PGVRVDHRGRSDRGWRRDYRVRARHLRLCAGADLRGNRGGERGRLDGRRDAAGAHADVRHAQIGRRSALRAVGGSQVSRAGPRLSPAPPLDAARLRCGGRCARRDRRRQDAGAGAGRNRHLMDRLSKAFWAVVDLPFKFLAIGLILLYRYTLSAFAGRTCRHMPTCSEYTADAIWKFGFWPGGWMGLARFSRCRPGGTHGYDPVPETLPPDAHWYAPWRYGRWKGGELVAPVRMRTDTASRLIEAPADRIYGALTDPEALAHWLD